MSHIILYLLITQGQRVLPTHANFRRTAALFRRHFSAFGFLPPLLDPASLDVCRKSRAVKRAFGAPELPNRILIPPAESVTAEGDQ